MNAPDLHVHCGYSTYDGFSSPQSVVDRAVELGWGAVCLTEHGWLGSAPALYKAAKKADIKPIIGCELYVTPEEMLVDGDKKVLAARRHLTVLALDIEGYQNLVTWANASMQRPAYYNGPRISLDRMGDIAPHPLHHNVVLSGCMGGELCQCLLHKNGRAYDAAKLYLDSARAMFPNFYIELHNHASDKFLNRGLTEYDQMIEHEEYVGKRLLDLSQELSIPVIITNDSHYQSQSQRKPHMAMMARKQWKQTSGEFSAHYIYWTNYMRSMEKIADSLPSWARKESIASIHEIVREADLRLDPLDKFSYTLPRSAHRSPVDEVVRRAKPRLKNMVGRHGSMAQDRFDYEVDAMRDFAHYLLIYSDIVRMCRSQGIYTWTRGSAANSLVNFCLRVHEIDPIHYRLMFERFVNPARAKFPDVDIDIEAHRQRDVARMITEYMAEVEGEGNVMPICTFSTLSNRNAFRIMAEAAGVAPERIDELAKLLPQMIDSGMVESDEEAYTLLFDELGIDIYKDAAAIFDQVGGVSQHACAFALGTRDRPLDRWVPNFRIGSSDAVVTQYNMKWIEELGFLKLDLLKLDTLSIMHSVARQLGRGIDWLDEIAMSEPGIYEIDEETCAMFNEGRTEGVHSMQGGVQRHGCMEVGIESVDDLIAVQALYRPGAGSRTGTDKSFVNRKHGREDWQSTNEFVGKYLDETYGYPIFQEQIMEMGFGMGMSGEEVDDLYKAIKTAKGIGRGARELFDEFEPTYRKHAKTVMNKEDADEVWGFWYAMQGYAFNRGHATSYGILSAKTGTILCHHPLQMFVALLERYPGNPRYLAASIREGFKFEAPDVNVSGRGFSRGSTDKRIKVGLVRVNGIGDGVANAIVRNQPFASVEDMIERVGSRFIKQGEKVNTIEILGSAGALESLGIEGEEDDATQFKLMNFVLHKPRAFKGIKPSLVKRRGGSWQFLGLQHGVEITEGKSFCAKLFWIPPEPAFTTKTSASGKWTAHLLTVVDENGIPFDLIASANKEHEAHALMALADCEDSVVCVEGKIRMPFDRGMNIGFTVWGIAGAEQDNPQMWEVDPKIAKYIVTEAKAKARERQR
jgi:DNA polymerase-3 subunit alpha